MNQLVIYQLRANVWLQTPIMKVAPLKNLLVFFSLEIVAFLFHHKPMEYNGMKGNKSEEHFVILALRLLCVFGT